MWTQPLFPSSPSLLLKNTITTFLLSLLSQTMNSTYQTHIRHESEGDREFSFWGSSNTISSDDQLGGNETRLNSEAGFEETHQRKTFKFEHSSFPPGNHHCSIVSDPSRSKAIAEGRMELMEMMQDMPESSYELSFQDMVVEQQVLQPEPDQNETFSDNTLVQSSSSKAQQPQQKKLKNKKKKNKSNNRPGQILRVESMDSETFLLKMFFPTSLGWMKKAKVQNGSKVSPRPSLQESIKQVGKEWRIKGFFTEDGVRQNSGGSSSSSDKSRYADRSFSFSHGCWPFFHHIKNKIKKLGG